MVKCPNCKTLLKKDNAKEGITIKGLSSSEKEAIHDHPTLLHRCPECRRFYVWFPHNFRWYEFYNGIWNFVLTERAIWSVS